jgi:molybdopterin synthase sulfur carrier subunit
MKVQVFAALKDYFDKEFEVDANIASITELRDSLIHFKPETGTILNNCRFAVDDEFVDMNFKLKSHDTIVIIPPSSGG